jgi:hypothetical protein
MSYGSETIKIHKKLRLDKRNGSTSWYARLTLDNGRRVIKSTGTDSFEDAKEHAMRLYYETQAHIANKLPASTRKFKAVAEHTIQRMQADEAAGRGKQAMQLLSAYWRKVDRVMFGHAADKGLGVDRWSFDELCEHAENRHLHFIAQSPISQMTFCATLNAMWDDFCVDAAPMRHNFITPIRSKRNAGGYIVKEIGGRRFSFAGLKCCHKRSMKDEPTELAATGRLRRILTRVSESRMSEALAVLHWQIAEEQRRVEPNICVLSAEVKGALHTTQ